MFCSCLIRERYIIYLLGKSTVDVPGMWESVPDRYQVLATVDASGRLHVGPFETLVCDALRASSSRLFRARGRILLGRSGADLHGWAASGCLHPILTGPRR